MDSWVIFVKDNEVCRVADFEEATNLCKTFVEIFGKENVSIIFIKEYK